MRGNGGLGVNMLKMVRFLLVRKDNGWLLL